MILFFSAFLLIFLILLIIYFIGLSDDKNTEDYKQTYSDFRSAFVRKDLPVEYSRFKCLDDVEGYKKILFNVYLPISNNETTEVDIIFLHESGIYVIDNRIKKLYWFCIWLREPKTMDTNQNRNIWQFNNKSLI